MGSNGPTPWLARTALYFVIGAVANLLARDPTPIGPVIVMDPLFTAGSGVSWRYTKGVDYEILSRYPDTGTLEFLKRKARAERLLGILVPEAFQAKCDLPQLIILCEKDMMSPMSDNILGSMSDTLLGASLRHSGGSAYSNVEVFDRDLIATLVTKNSASLGAGITLLSSAHVRYLMERRTPQLPSWLIAGVLGLYTRLEVAKTGIEIYEQQPDLVYRIPPFTWISEEETKKIRTGREFFGPQGLDASVLMSDVLNREVPKGNADAEVWMSRATLFVRWAIDGEHRPRSNWLPNFLSHGLADALDEPFEIDGTNCPHPEAFWKFVARSCKEPVTEAIFRECFGSGYADIAGQLAHYLPVAIKTPIDLQTESGAGEAAPLLRNATRTEITRITADWERLAVGGMKGEYQSYTSNFAKEALTQAYNRGARDPRLLAVLGLFCHDTGDDLKAKGFLETATRAGVVGPRAYFELAQIRYEQTRNSDNSAFSTAEADNIIKPLEAGHSQSPPLRESYDLAVKVLSNTDGTVTREQLALLDSGLQYFPRDMDLRFRIASLEAKLPTGAEASAVAHEGALLSLTPEDRDRFSKLQVEALGKSETRSTVDGGK